MRTDGMNCYCLRCNEGFRSLDDLRQHQQADIGCVRKDFDPTVGLPEDAIKDWAKRSTKKQSAPRETSTDAQWEDVCKTAFQSGAVIPQKG